MSGAKYRSESEYRSARRGNDPRVTSRYRIAYAALEAAKRAHTVQVRFQRAIGEIDFDVLDSWLCTLSMEAVLPRDLPFEFAPTSWDRLLDEGSPLNDPDPVTAQAEFSITREEDGNQLDTFRWRITTVGASCQEALEKVSQQVQKVFSRNSKLPTPSEYARSKLKKERQQNKQTNELAAKTVGISLQDYTVCKGENEQHEVRAFFQDARIRNFLQVLRGVLAAPPSLTVKRKGKSWVVTLHTGTTCQAESDVGIMEAFANLPARLPELLKERQGALQKELKSLTQARQMFIQEELASLPSGAVPTQDEE